MSESGEISHESIALSQYDILRRIFRSLPMKEVRRLASVCKIWNEVSFRARNERSRHKPVTFCWRAPRRPQGFYKDYEFPHSPDHLDFRRKLIEFVSELWIDPAVCMILSFGEPSDFLAEEALVDDQLQKILTLPGFHLDPTEIDNLLPKECIAISMAVSGVVLTQDNFEVCEIENMMCPPEVDVGVAMVFLPSCPNTKIIPFLVSETKAVLQNDIDDVKESRPDLSNQAIFDELLNRTCGYRLTPEDKIRCLITFTNNHEYPYITRLVKTIGIKTNRCAAVGGAVGNLARCSSGGETLYNCLEEFRENEFGNVEVGDDYLKSVGIVIVGDNVQAASVVIGKNIKAEDKLRQELLKLKSAGLSEERAVAFMENVESKMFRSVFPRVPLIGAFCGGEIGVTFLPNQPPPSPDPDLEQNPKRNKMEAAPYKDRDIAHSFTTVFVLIAF